jgi:hypothetical protein
MAWISRFPPGPCWGPGQYLVISDNPGTFATHFPGVTSIGPFGGSLSHNGERIQLTDTNNNVVDEVAYFDGGRWPEWPDGGGSSLERRSPFADGTAPENWAASNETSHGQWQTVSYTGSAPISAPTPPRGTNSSSVLLAEGSRSSSTTSA